MFDLSLSGLGWTSDGEILKDSDGDISQVSGFDDFIRRFMFLMFTKPREYRYDPSIGLGLPSFAGHVNTKQLRDKIKRLIERQLDRSEITYPFTTAVSVKKSGPTGISISLSVSDQVNEYSTALVFRLKDGQLQDTGLEQAKTAFTRTPKTHESSGDKHAEMKNKYLARKPRN